MAAAAMFSQLSDRFAKFLCGVSSPTTSPDDDDDHRSHRAELRSFLLLSPSSPERHPRRSSSGGAVAPVDDDDDVTAAAASLAEVSTEEHGGHNKEEEEEESATLPCLAFASEHGYKVFSLAHMRMLDDGADDVRPMPPVPGRRLVASPRGGTVLATDVCYRHPCHLADPFTGSRAPLPDLPIPFSEKEPVEHCRRRDEPAPRPAPRARAAVAVTDDGLAWDWSPRGVMVARGDTAFFCAHGGERWTPVHQSRLGSHMTVNYRGGLFFLLERRALETTVIDAGTLRACSRIPAPPGLDLDDVDWACLAPSSSDDAILLVHRARDGDSRGVLLTEAYRARHRGSRRPPKWKPVVDVGDRAVFVDGTHGFTVAADPAGAPKANRVYVILAHRVTRPCGRLAVAYDVGFCDLARPQRMGRMKLNAGEVELMWGQPHWIIPRGGSDRRQGSMH